MSKSGKECCTGSNQPGRTAEYFAVRSRRRNFNVFDRSLRSFDSVTSPQCHLQLEHGEYISGTREVPTTKCKLSASQPQPSQGCDRQKDVIPAYAGQPEPCGVQDVPEVARTPLLSSALGPRSSPGTSPLLGTSCEDVAQGVPITPLTDSLRDFFSRQAALHSTPDLSMPCSAIDNLQAVASRGDDAPGSTLSRPFHTALAEMLPLEQSSCSAAQDVGFRSTLHQKSIGGLDFDAAAAPDCTDSHHDTQGLETGVNQVRQMYPQLFETKPEASDVGQSSPAGKHEVQERGVASAVLGLRTSLGVPLLVACDQPDSAAPVSHAGSPRGFRRPEIDPIAVKVANPLGQSIATHDCESRITAACSIRDVGHGTYLPEAYVSGLSGRANKVLQRTIWVATHEVGDCSNLHHPGWERALSVSHDSDTSIQTLLQRAGISQHTIDVIVAAETDVPAATL